MEQSPYVAATVSYWNEDDGWGVLEAEEFPEGIWSFSRRSTQMATRLCAPGIASRGRCHSIRTDIATALDVSIPWEHCREALNRDEAPIR
jgi:hypothetical protein